MHRILVTGGAGFIGSVLASHLAADGHDVVVFDNLLHGEPRVPSSDVRLVEGDVRDRERVEAIVASTRPETVFHLAALHYIPYCDEHPNETIDVNVHGTDHLLDACRTYPPERLFFASSAAVYAPADAPHPETDPVVPIDIYGLTKAFGEAMVARFQQETDVRCSVGRLFNVFGPRDTNRHVVPEVVGQVLAESSPTVRVKLGNTHTVRDYVYVDDAVTGICAALDAGAGGGVFNIGTGIGTSVLELVTAIAEAADKTAEIVTDAARVRKVDRPHLVADAGLLQGASGWSPRSDVASGLEALLDAERALLH